MVFNSAFFVLTLLPLLGFYYLVRRKRSKPAKLILLLYSYFFYGMWNAAFLLLILASTLIDYFAALLIVARPKRKGLLLLLSLITNFGLLGFFKYFNFFNESAAWIASLLSIHYEPWIMRIVLPVGISFYTFQTLSYTIDVYRGGLPARKSLLDFALFVTFFPQLVAGPIVRAADFIPQLDIEPKITSNAVAHGIFLVLWGLFLKMVIADNVAARADALFASWQSNGLAATWAAGLLFGVQIYCDFNGYSMIAIGLAMMMGFWIQRNFRAPYAAVGMSDFWARWHMSLSSWLRDYLYIPLGGNRKGRVRTYINLMLTMLLGGLWHGASIMFVLWGAIHGLGLVIERLIRAALGLKRKPKAEPASGKLSFGGRAVAFGGIFATYLLVTVTWIPFRARSFEQCFGMLGRMFAGPAGGYPLLLRDLAIVGAVFVAHVVGRDWDRGWLRFAAAAAMLLAIYYVRGAGTEFIYFQF
jgi:alginate O-acetyltransferase complex protein AlgI